MSYCSRVYRQRNAHTHDESKKEPFFSKENDIKKSHQPGTFFQAKLTVNQPGDSYEQEADSVANAVVNKTTKGPIVQHKKISSIQRLATSMEDEKLSTNDARMAKDKEIQEKPIQRMTDVPEKEKSEDIQKTELPGKDEKENIQKKEGSGLEEDDKLKTEAVQTKASGNTKTASPHVTSKIESTSGKGNVLPAKTKMEMSSSFGVDFSGVRIHKDSEAVNLNKELQAQAFTRGNDIYFNEGKFDPESSEGKFLLAHELTHVVQQNDDLQRYTIQRRVIDRNVTTNQVMLNTLGLSRQQVIDAITSADADSISLAQNAEDILRTQLANARTGNVVDANSEIILNEELGISFNDPGQHSLIRQQIGRFRTVKETLQSGYLRYMALGTSDVKLVGCRVGSCGVNHAFSCPGNRLVVLCQPFWDFPNPINRGAVILHEPFHIWFHMASHEVSALKRADASCFESFALRASGSNALRSCVNHTGG
ncbi:MAG: DUF4157 domain-containing protein [Saprospiraceae bacterium]|uniref:DUF4157 domain-containing protein n=1 Tax=Candidatus Opimibacter skivensis TaxID=2982028 RepID=A0A9D7SXD7_9BACT|nr:DUF4157 domain-containing protein [Candidatus Opimibacter skivensis]